MVECKEEAKGKVDSLRPGDLDDRQNFENSQTWKLRFGRVDARKAARKELESGKITLSRCIEMIITFKESYKALKTLADGYPLPQTTKILSGEPNAIRPEALILYVYEIREDLKVMKKAIAKGLDILELVKDFSYDDLSFMRIVSKPEVVSKIPKKCKPTYKKILQSAQSKVANKA